MEAVCTVTASDTVAALGLQDPFLAVAQVATLAPQLQVGPQVQADAFAKIKLIPRPVQVKDAFLGLNLV